MTGSSERDQPCFLRREHGEDHGLQAFAVLCVRSTQMLGERLHHGIQCRNGAEAAMSCPE